MEKGIRVLLVDDEVSFTQTMAFWFESKGCSVTTAHDGQSALDVIQSNPPDIVFLDLNMPIMDGVETLKHLRKINKDLPVIIISAYLDDQKKMLEIRQQGISGVFYKGKDFDKCLSLLETALRR
ncbi:MAG: response regulator, partial [Candidatus Omnitrophica bacterium]|nr:response regulator [Candidatus Omnitrophota bacterium]